MNASIHEPGQGDCEKASQRVCRCQNCGSDELVRARIDRWNRLGWRGARCLVCGERFLVPNEVYNALRKPELGEPYETLGDRWQIMLHQRMRPLHLATTLGAFGVGVVVACYLFRRFPYTWPPAIAILACTVGGWLCGWRLSPSTASIPGHCPLCRYDLRGTISSRCPECGAQLDENKQNTEEAS